MSKHEQMIKLHGLELVAFSSVEMNDEIGDKNL